MCSPRASDQSYRLEKMDNVDFKQKLQLTDDDEKEKEKLEKNPEKSKELLLIKGESYHRAHATFECDWK